MKKTYKKTFEIEAEQFDGSEEMAKEYEMTMSPAGVYYVNDFDGFKPIREGDWLISNGEDIAIVDNDYFEEHYKLVEDDEPTDWLAKAIETFKAEERKAQQFDVATYIIAKLALDVQGINKKLDEIKNAQLKQEQIRHNEKVAQSSAYNQFVDELAEALRNLL